MRIQSGLSETLCSSNEGGLGSGASLHLPSLPPSGIGRPPTPHGPGPVVWAAWGATWASMRKNGRGSAFAWRMKSSAWWFITRVV